DPASHWDYPRATYSRHPRRALAVQNAGCPPCLVIVAFLGDWMRLTSLSWCWDSAPPAAWCGPLKTGHDAARPRWDRGGGGVGRQRAKNLDKPSIVGTWNLARMAPGSWPRIRTRKPLVSAHHRLCPLHHRDGLVHASL